MEWKRGALVMDAILLGPVLHGFHTAHGGREWLLPLMLLAGLGTALLARWLGRFFRHAPPDHDEPI
jgi:hypothetical protein